MNAETNDKKQDEVEMTFMDRLGRFMFGWLEGGCYVNVVLCACGVACAALGSGGRLYAVCGWICATCAWASVCNERVWTKRWHSLADKAMTILESALGGKVVSIYEVHKDAPEEPEAEKAEVANEADKKGIPEKTERFVKHMADCTVEAFEYLKNGNYDFTVSAGGVELVVHDYEVAAEPAPEPAPEASKYGQDAPQA